MLLFFLTALLFQVQGSLHFSFPFCVVIVGVLLFVEESYTTPLHSFLQELGIVEN